MRRVFAPADLKRDVKMIRLAPAQACLGPWQRESRLIGTCLVGCVRGVRELWQRMREGELPPGDWQQSAADRPLVVPTRLTVHGRAQSLDAGRERGAQGRENGT